MLVAAITGSPAMVLAMTPPYPNVACTTCHDQGGVDVTATPSSKTVAPGATFSVTTTWSGDAKAGKWPSGVANNALFNPTPAYAGPNASSLATTFTAPQTLGSYTLSVFAAGPNAVGGQADVSIRVGTPTPTPTPKPTPVVFVSNGLVGDGTDTDLTAFFKDNGFLAVTTTWQGTQGTFSGNLRLEGKTFPVKGAIVDGNATVTIKRTPANTVLALSFDKATGAVTGNVTTGAGSPLAVTALPAVSQTAKRYTVVLPSPDVATFGHGYATLTVAANGTAVLTGKLADGTACTSTSRTVDDGSGNWLIPVYVPLYKASAGMLTGDVLLPKSPTDGDVVGSLDWLRPADPKSKVPIFQTGFLDAINPVGGVYTFVKGTALIPGGTFALTTDIAIPGGLWPATNVPSLPKPAKITFASATGMIKGSFCHTVGGKVVSTPFEGVALASPLTVGADSVQGAGFFLTPNPTTTVSGPVELVP